MFMRAVALLALAGIAFLQIATAATLPNLLKHQVEEIEEHDSVEHLLNQRQSTNASGFTVVTGITGTSPQPRLEIRQLEKNADQWNIYLLGLARYMRMNETEKLSYYQIAGIHGRPYSPWDRVPSAPGINSPGYCLHLSQMFLAWHRPYLALYEQALYTHIVAAANEFPAGPVRTRYAQAALSWRHPYWDWAAAPPAGQSVWPTSLSNPTVTVTMPNGTNTIPNPLYSYRFHPVSKADFFYDPWSEWNTTLRYPLGGQVQNAVSQDQLIGPVLDNSRISFRDRLYNLFTFYDNFTEFGTESYTFGNNFSNADSLESLHDVIHGVTGSGGHMTYLDYSAFDPVFWLHHTMVDRCFALWQALHPESYVQPGKTFQNSFTIPQGTTVDLNTPLDPFHRDAQGTKWTPDAVRSTRTFGYTYPELPANANTSSVKAAVNRLYGSAAGSTGLQLSKRFFDEPDSAISERDVSAQGRPHHPKRREFIANIVSEKFALNGSYAIYVFMGDYDGNDPTCWPTSANLVGTHAVFAALPNDAAGNGQMSTPSIQVTGSVPLTSMLIEKARSRELGSMKPQDIEDYLADNLQWRVVMFDGTEVPVANVPGLAVNVVAADVTPSTRGDDFPRWGNWNQLKRVTDSAGASCGAS